MNKEFLGNNLKIPEFKILEKSLRNCWQQANNENAKAHTREKNLKKFQYMKIEFEKIGYRILEKDGGGMNIVFISTKK